MNILTMTEAELRALPLPRLKWDEDSGEFDSLIILPAAPDEELHDSGYRVMAYIAVRDSAPICLLSDRSDILHINGIGGFGEWRPLQGGPPAKVEPIGWAIDCLPVSGLLTLWCGRKLRAKGGLSSFEIYASGRPQT